MPVENKENQEGLTQDDLQKSLDKLADFATDDGPGRKEQLLQKALTEDLSEEENTELIQLMGGGEAIQKSGETDSGEAIVKSYTDNEGLDRAIDVSEYLKEHHDALTKSLGAIGEEIQKSDHRRHEFAMLQARALVDMGNMMKSMSETLGAIADQPVRAPKSKGAGNAQPLQKSFGGQPPAEDQLTKSDVFEALDGLFQESMEKGMGGRLASGEDLALATTKYESSSMLSPGVLNAVKEYRGRKAAH